MPGRAKTVSTRIAAELDAEVDADDGEDGQGRIAERVLGDDQDSDNPLARAVRISSCRITLDIADRVVRVTMAPSDGPRARAGRRMWSRFQPSAFRTGPMVGRRA